MNSQKGDTFLSPNEAAKYTGRTTRTLDRYVRIGVLTKHKAKVGRNVFYKLSDLDRIKQIV